jgi:hypothetical protein
MGGVFLAAFEAARGTHGLGTGGAAGFALGAGVPGSGVWRGDCRGGCLMRVGSRAPGWSGGGSA